MRSMPALAWEGRPEGGAAIVSRGTIAPSSEEYFSPVAWDKQYGQLPPENRNQFVHPQVTTGTLTEP